MRSAPRACKWLVARITHPKEMVRVPICPISDKMGVLSLFVFLLLFPLFFFFFFFLFLFFYFSGHGRTVPPCLSKLLSERGPLRWERCAPGDALRNSFE
jgi:hypothetical protein